MSECHKCRTATEIKKGTWRDVPFNQTPCARCQLREDSYGTMEYREADPANASRDHNPDDEQLEAAELAGGKTSAQFETHDTDDPLVPLSILTEAMATWLDLSLPARKVFQMRKQKLPYSTIGQRLGISRQAAESLIAKAIGKDGRLNNLLPEKKKRPNKPLYNIHTSAIADNNKEVKGAKNSITVSRKPSFVTPSETRTA
jgi:hypothetical protein